MISEWITGLIIIFLALCYLQSLRNLHKAKKEIEEYRDVFIPIKDLIVSNGFDVEDIVLLVKLGINEKKGFVISHKEDLE